MEQVERRRGLIPGRILGATLPLRGLVRILPVLGSNNRCRIRDAPKVCLDRESWFRTGSRALGRKVS